MIRISQNGQGCFYWLQSPISPSGLPVIADLSVSVTSYLYLVAISSMSRCDLHRFGHNSAASWKQLIDNIKHPPRGRDVRFCPGKCFIGKLQAPPVSILDFTISDEKFDVAHLVLFWYAGYANKQTWNTKERHHNSTPLLLEQRQKKTERRVCAAFDTGTSSVENWLLFSETRVLNMMNAFKFL